MSSDLSSIQSQFNLNSVKSNPESVYEFEDFRLDAAHLMLYRDEERTNLAPKVVETLLALVERGGEIVSKEEMMERLWKNSFVEESNLTQNIYLLRKTLGKGADGRDLIETFRRRGYRFTGAIKSRAENSSAGKTEEPALERSEQPNAFDSLAVLPFKNESNDDAAEYLSDGVTESIINRLSQLEDFRVVARNTVFRYKNAEIDQRKIGRDLSVSAVLTGRILQLGEKLIVRTELVDAVSGWQIWGAQYDRLFVDVLDLQETIAREISEKLELKLSGEEKRRLAKRDTQSSEAYDFYVKGRYFLNKRLTETIEQATVFFQKAIDLDPSYALAFVGLADCYPLLSLYGKLTPREAYPKAETAARKALEIDDRLAEAYNSLGVVKLFYEWDWSGAEKAFQKAIALNPNYADAHQRYGMLLTVQERFDESVAEFEKAIRLDPLSLIIKTISGYPFYYSHRFDQAAERFREVIAADENYSMAHFRLGLTCAQTGDFDKAIAEFEKSSSLSNDRDSIAALAYVQALAGNREKAVAALAELDEREKKGFVTSYNRALIKIGLDEKDSALDWLEKAFEERSYWLIYLKVDPALDALRKSARFAALQKEIFGISNQKIEVSQQVAETQKNVSSDKRFFGLRGWHAAAVFGLLLLVILGLSWFYWREKSDAALNTRTANVTLKRLTPDIHAIYSAISRDGKYLVYAPLENGKRSLWVKDIATGSARQIMPPNENDYGAPQFSPDGSRIYYTSQRNNRWAIVRIPVAGGVPQQISEETTSPFTLSPDGNYLAFVREPESLMIANTDGSGERILSQRGTQDKWFESWGSHLSFSPDGSSIAVCGGRVENGKPRRVLTEISVADASERDIPVPHWDNLDSVQWIPDGSGLIVIAREVSGSPFQIWRIAYPSGALTRVTQDLNEYNSISISGDSRLLVAVQETGSRNIWTVPLADSKQARQITFGSAANDGFWGIDTMPDGRIVYTSPRGGNSDLWIMNADGSNQKQLTANAGANQRPTVTPDGRYIFFQSDRGGTNWHIWRIDADGGNPKQMTDGESFQTYPTAAPDGRWVYFTWGMGQKSIIWKIPVEGGEPMRVSPAENVGVLSVSPDGKLLAINKYDREAKLQWQVGIIRADTGEVVRWFDYYLYGRIGWTPDSKYVISFSNINLLKHPIDGGAAQPLTNFDAQQIRAFDISADGKMLVVSRGNSSTEAILLENF